MGKLITTVTVYSWKKDEEDANDPSYRVLTDEEYEARCKECGLDTLEGLFEDDGEEAVDYLEASYDNYSASGYRVTVKNIPDSKVKEVKQKISEYEKLQEYFAKF